MKVKIKTLEGRVWKLCKEIIRAKYPHVCISCGKNVEGSSLHTGHYFRKRYLPLPMKYDLRLLRPQCSYCNLRLHGNLEWYTVGLLKSHTAEYIMQIAKEVEYWKDYPMGTKEAREFLLGLEQEYDTLRASYQRMA
jgi:hypothetical protein